MSKRDALITEFLGATPWRDATRRPLAGDASFRRYERLEGGPRPALLMDAPPPQEDVRPYIAVASHLNRLGLSAPEIFEADEASGLLVIEDFGDTTYTRRLANGASEDELYRLAIDALIAMHKSDEVLEIELPPYDEERLLEEATLFTDWYLLAVFGEPASPQLRQQYVEIWRALFPLADGVPRTLVHKDYHVDNLMWLDGREGVRRCGMLDFQDAVIGSMAYDLVSLLEDARRDVSPALRESMTAHYLDSFAGLDPERFLAAAAMLSAQRNCKIIGIFTRLFRRDGKPDYLPHIRRVWRLLEMDVAHPSLGPLRRWLTETVPPARRIVPEA